MASEFFIFVLIAALPEQDFAEGDGNGGDPGLGSAGNAPPAPASPHEGLGIPPSPPSPKPVTSKYTLPSSPGSGSSLLNGSAYIYAGVGPTVVLGRGEPGIDATDSLLEVDVAERGLGRGDRKDRGVVGEEGRREWGCGEEGNGGGEVETVVEVEGGGEVMMRGGGVDAYPAFGPMGVELEAASTGGGEPGPDAEDRLRLAAKGSDLAGERGGRGGDVARIGGAPVAVAVADGGGDGTSIDIGDPDSLIVAIGVSLNEKCRTEVGDGGPFVTNSGLVKPPMVVVLFREVIDGENEVLALRLDSRTNLSSSSRRGTLPDVTEDELGMAIGPSAVDLLEGVSEDVGAYVIESPCGAVPGVAGTDKGPGRPSSFDLLPSTLLRVLFRNPAIMVLVHELPGVADSESSVMPP
ncbi:hypothetical protein DXG01_014375 [Tephrocybe rancida]|nr:hypothetical protein DXG01_014375 [Tephrocybe rancida]